MGATTLNSGLLKKKTKSPVESHTYGAPALEKGFNVMELLANAPAGLTASEIAAGLGLSMSKIFRILMVMERRHWLKKGDGDKYRVTSLVLDLAFRASPTQELTVVAAPYMREFSRLSDQSCHLVIQTEQKGLVIMPHQNPGPTGFYVRVGTTLDLETTCSGHVLLAFSKLSPEMLTPDADLDPRLQATLRAVRQRGYEHMESTRTLGVTDVSYPIFNFHGEVAAALTVPFLRLIDGTQTVQLDQARDLLSTTAAHITDELSGRDSRDALLVPQTPSSDRSIPGMVLEVLAGAQNSMTSRDIALGIMRIQDLDPANVPVRNRIIHRVSETLWVQKQKRIVRKAEPAGSLIRWELAPD